MASLVCMRCSRALDAAAVRGGGVVQCPACGYIGAAQAAASVAAPPVQSPQASRHAGFPAPVAPPVQRPRRPAASELHRSWSRSFLILLAACGAVSLAALLFGNGVTRLAVPLVALAALNGYRVGGLKVTAGLLGLAVGALLGVPVGCFLEGLVGLAGFSGLTGRVVSIVVWGAGLAVLAAWLLDRHVARRLRARPAVARCDPWVGTGLGAAQGLLLVFIALWGVLALEPVAATRVAMHEARAEEETPPDPTAVRILGLAEMVHGSLLGRVAEAANPLAAARVVTLPNKCMALLSDPAALRTFNRHPAVRRIHERPAVKEVLRVLAEDPQINEIIDSDKGLTGGDIARLLGHPKLLEAIDRSEVLSEITPIADEIEQAVDDALAEAARREPGAPTGPAQHAAGTGKEPRKKKAARGRPQHEKARRGQRGKPRDERGEIATVRRARK